MDGRGGAVTFQAADVAAVAGLAVDINGDMADFGGCALRAVDEVAESTVPGVPMPIAETSSKRVPAACRATDTMSSTTAALP